MGAWGVVPSLTYITKVAACPTCKNLDKARRPRTEFLPSYPELGGSSWVFSISLKDARSATEAGCQFCAVLSNIFQHILTTESQAVDSPEATVTVHVPINPKRRRDFSITFKYNAAQADLDHVQPLSKGYFLATVGKCTNTANGVLKILITTQAKRDHFGSCLGVATSQ